MTSVQNAAATVSGAASGTAPPPWSLFGSSSTPGRDGAVRTVRSPEQIEEARQFAGILREQAEPQWQTAASEAAASAPRSEAQSAAPPVRPVAYIASTKAEDRWEEHGDATGLADGGKAFGEDGLTLGDIVDVVNPLQHLPIVSTIYRNLTGDEISPAARIAGDTLYGGPIGLASGIANTIMEESTGSDFGETVMASLFGSEDDTGTALADAATTQAATEAAALAPAAGNASRSAASVQEASLPVAPKEPLISAPTQTSHTPGVSPLFAAQPPGIPLASSQAHAYPLTGPAVAKMRAEQSPVQSPVQSQAQSPAQAAAQGVPTLSPEAANVLMRMAQESAAQQAPIVQAPIVQAPVARASAAQAPTPPAAAAPAPTAPPVSTASATAEPSKPVQTASAEFVEPVPVADLPAAMMEALSRYEALKAGG